MMKTYKAKKKGMLYLMIGYIVMMAGFFFLHKETFFENRYLFVLIILPTALILWPLLHTYYKIQGDKLFYRSGFIHGEIDINNIKEVIKGKTMWVGLKPALATGGIIIKYNRFDDIYLAPTNNEELIEDLLKLNRDIVVSG
jgi:hypothetical protein